ncbi:hypothetical protein L1887_39408 [Cichorium endivia]|nr:hypothetical protein L1887_39408 [Cichorium endivia]
MYFPPSQQLFKNMAEADPKHLPNKWKEANSFTTIVRGGTPLWKHANKSLASNEDELEDTASSKPKEEEIEKVELTNIEIMQEILSYKMRKGVCPTKSPDDLQRFCYFYIRLGVGNKGGWLNKMEEMKNKFNTESDSTRYADNNEFELWKKIWGNE